MKFLVRGPRCGWKFQSNFYTYHQMASTTGVRKLFSSLNAQSSGFSPEVFREVPPLRTFRHQLLLENRSVGLVPTMGALHEGHISLVRQAAHENSDVFISIYVNPTQFGVTEDLSTYPRTWDEDLRSLAKLDEELASQPGSGRITAIFAPTTKIMYPTLPPSSEINGLGSFVSITPLGQILEGKSRPVFFRGVATICMKLFNIVQPTRVYFGQKDIQQTAIIRRMITDFHLPVEFRMGRTMRESDGLAMSSRNVYLGERRRNAGLALSQALRFAEAQYLSGKTNASEIRSPGDEYLQRLVKLQEQLPPSERALFKTDYISLADPDTLEEVVEVDENKGAILSGAIIMQPLESKQPGERLGLGGDAGTVRLIDNIILQPRS